MATLMQRNMGVKDVGQAVSVPNNDLARVMYYLRSVTVSCGLDVIMDDLVDFKNYHLLSKKRADHVFAAAYQFSPDELLGKTIFLDLKGALPANKNNMFLEITQATNFVHVQKEAMICGKSTGVKEIMIFNQDWLNQNYIRPMKRNVHRISRAGRKSSKSCHIQ